MSDFQQEAWLEAVRVQQDAEAAAADWRRTWGDLGLVTRYLRRDIKELTEYAALADPGSIIQIRGDGDTLGERDLFMERESLLDMLANLNPGAVFQVPRRIAPDRAGSRHWTLTRLIRWHLSWLCEFLFLRDWRYIRWGRI